MKPNVVRDAQWRRDHHTLSKLGRAGGIASGFARREERDRRLELREILATRARELSELEMWERQEAANELICPVD